MKEFLRTYGLPTIAILAALHTHTAQASHAGTNQENIAWLQETNRRLTNPNNHKISIMKHFAQDIARKIEQNPDLATMPFVRSNSSHNYHHHECAPLPTSETTLFLVAIEEATTNQALIPVINALLQCAVDPFAKFDLSHENGQERVQDSYFNTLVKLTTVDRHPTKASVEALIHVLDYGMQKMDPLEEYARCTKAFYQLPDIPDDHKRTIQEFLSGTRQELSLARRLIRALKIPDRTGATLLDKVIQKSETTMPPWLYNFFHAGARHTLQTYLLQHGAPLKQQTSLHSQRIRNMAGNTIQNWMKCACLIWSSPYCYILGVGSGLAIWVGLGMQLESSTPAETLEIWKAVAHFIKDLAIGKLAITRKALIFFKLGTLASFFGSFIVLPQPRNIISERVRAWINGITDIWGRKKEVKESYADEVGGLE